MILFCTFVLNQIFLSSFSILKKFGKAVADLYAKFQITEIRHGWYTPTPIDRVYHGVHQDFSISEKADIQQLTAVCNGTSYQFFEFDRFYPGDNIIGEHGIV